MGWVRAQPDLLLQEEGAQCMGALLLLLLLEAAPCMQKVQSSHQLGAGRGVLGVLQQQQGQALPWCRIPCSNASPLHPCGPSIPAPMHPHCISVVPASPAATHPHCIPTAPASLHQHIPMVPASPHQCIPIASLWCLHPCTNASPRCQHPCTNASPLHLRGAYIPRSNASKLHPNGASIPAPMHPHGASMPPQMHPHCILVVPASLHQRIPCSNAPPSHPTHQCIPAAILHRCSTAPKRAADPPSSPPLPSSSSSRWGQRDAGSRSCARRVGWEVLASGNACVPGGGRKHLAEQRG